jgi:hypothetical protein
MALKPVSSVETDCQQWWPPFCDRSGSTRTSTEEETIAMTTGMEREGSLGI